MMKITFGAFGRTFESAEAIEGEAWQFREYLSTSTAAMAGTYPAPFGAGKQMWRYSAVAMAG